MSAILAGRFEHDSPDWHAARAGGIGGSEIAAVLGLSPYESRFSLWHRKAGIVGPQPDSDEKRRGHYLEPAVAAWFADQHPEYAVRTAGTYQHADRPWQRANPDRLLTVPRGRRHRALLECKTDAEAWKWGTPGTDQVPIYYRTQVIWYLDVLGLDLAHVAVLLGQLEFAEYVVEYNAAEAALLREAAREFLDSIAAGAAPDIDEHAETYRVIRELHPDIDGTTVEIPAAQAQAFVQARAALADATDREQLERSRLADAMGNARYAECNEHKLARRQAKGGGLPFVVADRNLPDPTDLERSTAA